ncbi:unnamed protein product [Caenorhabditis angaria]|uniref:Tr-type G domain-containing protein n=1 Tax=Caenorhabditis angaria TaxID=860376 RepID=A0A9P1N6V7_9PELO|nr:unnamed protein product [Caenorhabditis angaria]
MDFMISHFCDEQNHQPLYKTRKQSLSDGSRPKLLSSSLPDDFSDMENENCLPPETELGNIEYKAKLVNPTTSRIQHLITQMKWRLREGQGEAIYEVGVEDGGHMTGLTDHELNASLTTLRTMAQALDASMVILTEKDVTKIDGVRRTVVEVLVRKVPESQQFIELRLAVIGAADVGKSTLCGVLTQGALDDGNGKTRLNLFRFPHEVRTGKTSSVCIDVVGFDNRGKLVNYSQNSLEELVEKSTKLVTLIDLAGDNKYMKTTIHGLSGYIPHFSCLVVAADCGPTSATREHLGLVAALNIPMFVLITKKDLVDKQQLESVIRNVSLLLHKAGMTTLGKRVKTKRDAVKAAQQLCTNSIVPIICVSSVTGEGFRLVRTLMNLLSTAGTAESRLQLVGLPTFFQIEELFQVPHVGQVVGGMLSEGQLHEGANVLVGPTKDGMFHEASIGSIRRSRQAVACVNPGEAASIALNVERKDVVLRRGMVISSLKHPPIASFEFSANLFLLYHPTRQINEGFQTTVFIGSICGTASITKIYDDGLMRQGRWCRVEMRWTCAPEVIRSGNQIIFRHGKTKGMGEVVDVVPIVEN